MSIPEPFYRGKVRDLYPVDENSMIIVATDRVSAFDVVFEEAVPEKGRVLTSISMMWFNAIRDSGLLEELEFEDHLITDDIDQFPAPYTGYRPFAGRAVHVKRVKRIDYECVVRGYLAGSGWKEYKATGIVGGHSLPEGLQQASRLPSPIFTPSTKAPDGEHDENITVEKMKGGLGTDLTNRLEKISLRLFDYASELMSRAGIILCDTKFEFGLLDGKVVLIDEALTPDSSRYWDSARYKTGTNPPGFDKQYIRDYAEQTGWNKSPPAPPLPADVIQQTSDLYLEIEKRIADTLEMSVTGK